jgi:hypothetical protein
LARFFLLVGREEEKNADDYLGKLQQEIAMKNKMSTTHLTPTEPKSNCLKEEKLGENLRLGLRENLNQVQIISKCQTPLADLWKVFYSDHQQRGYFLINSYQKERALPNLIVGRVMNIHLIQGTKHRFFNKIQSNTIQHKYNIC